MKNLILQVCIVIVVFNLVSAFRETSMLSSWDVNRAPNYTLLNLDKKQSNLFREDSSNKTILYFFAPWCSVCRASIENLQITYQNNSSIDIKAIALDYSSQAEVEDFANDLSLTFPILLGDEHLKNAYKVTAYPSYYVVNEKQQIEHRSMGYSTELGLFLRSL